MKRPALLLGALLAAAPLLAAPAAKPSSDGTAALRADWAKHEAWFANPRLGPSKQLRVDATDDYLETRGVDKKRALEELAAAWRSRGTAGAEPFMLEVRWPYGGWIWEARRDAKSGREKLTMVDRWEDAGFPWIYEAATQDKWFLFLGGQSVSGGSIGSSSGFNARFGTTLLRGKYDVAVTFNRTSTGPTPKIELNAFGLMGRALFRKSDEWGYNIGGQIVAISGENLETENQVSALFGLNLYQGNGTWDLTLNLGDEGSRTLILGYSIFLSR